MLVKTKLNKKTTCKSNYFSHGTTFRRGEGGHHLQKHDIALILT